MTQDIHFTASGKQIEDALNNAVRANLSSMFYGPSQYNKQAGPGYAVVEDRILDWARTANLDQYIEAEAMKAIEKVLPAAVERAIKNRAGVVLSSLIRSGELDDRIATVIESNWIKKEAKDA